MSLCLTCGLCCDGSLFAVAAVTPKEARRLEGRVHLSENKLRLRQPCLALGADKTCAVYDERPQACRAFRCSVLLQLESGHCTSEEAHDAIADALERRVAVARAVGLDDLPAALVEARARIEAKTASPELEEAWHRFLRAAVLLTYAP